ncbi:MAG TPA: alkaline phosphatase PhoX [Burkholderiales bacterium]|nr:alkaline phosphatase PhoX [Burkholderiales bacterium]
MRTLLLASMAGLGLLAGAAAADGDGFRDFGSFRDDLLRMHSLKLFGVDGPLTASSGESIPAAVANADPTRLVTLARGLHARVVSAVSNLGANVDMMAPWPDDRNPTHLIVCNEQGVANPGVQRVRLTDGSAETILTGTTSCDPVHRTPWGTIIVGEEATDGNIIEIINPLATTNVLFNRVTGTTSGGVGASNVVTRPAVGRLAFEGIALYPNGVMYYGDENRPFNGTAGGAYFKFIPTNPWAGGPPITSLADSPLASGNVFGLRLGKRSGNTDYGQGSNTGLGTWIEIPSAGNPATRLRTEAANNKLTGYYRPEDIDIDAKALAEGKVRFCGVNTGNESEDRNWGEVVCFTDGTLDQALANTAIPEAHLFVAGNPEQAMMDNVAYQPGRGNWIFHEDGDGPEVGRNNDLWSCLEDGADDDRLSDGCIRIATLNDLNAEWTGGIFDASGQRFFVSVQHNVTGHGVILEITGWQQRREDW